jgi:hypothetical protein
VENFLQESNLEQKNKMRDELENYYEKSVLPEIVNIEKQICNNNVALLLEVMQTAITDSLSGAEDLSMVLASSFLCNAEGFKNSVYAIKISERKILYDLCLFGLLNRLYQEGANERDTQDAVDNLTKLFQ